MVSKSEALITKPTFVKIPSSRIETPLFVLQQNKDITYSMAALALANLRPFTLFEALLALKDDLPKRLLRGETFYVSGQRAGREGVFAIRDNGRFVRPNGEESPENLIRVFSGSPLLGVIQDKLIPICGMRFVIGLGDGSLDSAATIVVGVSRSWNRPDAELFRSLRNFSRSAGVGATDLKNGWSGGFKKSSVATTL